MKTSTSSKIKHLLIVLGWLLAWEIVYLCVGNKLLLAGPVDTLVRLGEDVISSNFWITIASSFLHIATGFLVGLVLGICLAICSYKWKLFEEILFPVIGFLKAAPVAAFVVLFLIWWRSNVLSVAICICVVTPQIYVPFLEGLRKTDRKLLEMADVFELSSLDRFFFILRPALKPYMASALKIAAAMAWKSGVAAEVIGTPSFSIGEGLYKSKITLDTAGVFSWTLVIILISILCEKVLLKILDIFCSWDVKAHGSSSSNESEAGNCTSEVLEDGSSSSNKSEAGYCTSEVSEDGTVSSKSREVGCLKGANIYFSYTDALESDGKCKRVLSDVSFEYHKGNVYMLNTPSGSGKTTLLNIIAGLLVPESGSLEYYGGRAGSETGGRVKTGLHNTNFKVSYCFQEERLCEEVSAIKNVALVCGEDIAYEYLKPLFDDARNDGNTDSVVKALLGKKVSELSGGQRRRVSIARAIAKNADVVLLDEPYNGLDEDNIAKVKAYISHYCSDKIVVIASHIE